MISVNELRTKAEELYWVDLGIQGFEILSLFREHYPYTKSFLMDRDTFQWFFEQDKDKPSGYVGCLQFTEEECALYNLLQSRNWRLEQEKYRVGM